MAEQSAGIRHSWRFSVAVRASQQAGKVNSHLLCTARHVHYFKEHGETAPGDELTFQINPEMVVQGRTEAITQDMAHGPHFDRVTLSYTGLATGDVLVQFLGIHQIWGRIGEPDQPRIAPLAPPGGSTQPVTPGTAPPNDSEYRDKPPPSGPTKRGAKMPSKPERGRRS